MEHPTTGQDRVRVMLVEDHTLVRSALRTALSDGEMEVVAEAGTAEQARDLAFDLRPDIVLLDLKLPGMSGLELLSEVAHRLPGTRFIVLSASTDQRDVMDAMRRGAAGYLGKDLSPEALRRTVLGASRGELALSRRAAGDLVPRLLDLLPRLGGAEPDEGLTERERDVLRLLAEGLTDREIAVALGVSPRTAESHVSSILRKLGLRNRAEAARRYHQGA